MRQMRRRRKRPWIVPDSEEGEIERNFLFKMFYYINIIYFITFIII